MKSQILLFRSRCCSASSPHPQRDHQLQSPSLKLRKDLALGGHQRFRSPHWQARCLQLKKSCQRLSLLAARLVLHSLLGDCTRLRRSVWPSAGLHCWFDGPCFREGATAFLAAAASSPSGHTTGTPALCNSSRSCSTVLALCLCSCFLFSLGPRVSVLHCYLAVQFQHGKQGEEEYKQSEGKKTT